MITFGDTVKMQVSDSQNADEISEILALLQAKDKKTNLYRAFDQCLKYVEAESQKERQDRSGHLRRHSGYRGCGHHAGRT